MHTIIAIFREGYDVRVQIDQSSTLGIIQWKVRRCHGGVGSSLDWASEVFCSISDFLPNSV